MNSTHLVRLAALAIGIAAILLYFSHDPTAGPNSSPAPSQDAGAQASSPPDPLAAKGASPRAVGGPTSAHAAPLRVRVVHGVKGSALTEARVLIREAPARLSGGSRPDLDAWNQKVEAFARAASAPCAQEAVPADPPAPEEVALATAVDADGWVVTALPETGRDLRVVATAAGFRDAYLTVEALKPAPAAVTLKLFPVVSVQVEVTRTDGGDPTALVGIRLQCTELETGLLVVGATVGADRTATFSVPQRPLLIRSCDPAWVVSRISAVIDPTAPGRATIQLVRVPVIQLRDSVDGAPVGRASVRVTASSEGVLLQGEFSSSTGTYALVAGELTSAKPVSDVEVYAYASGYRAASQRIPILAQDTDATLRLDRDNKSFTDIRVVRAGTPIVGALVAIADPLHADQPWTPETVRLLATAATDVAGSARLPPVQGKHLLLVRHDTLHFGPVAQFIDLPRDDMVEVDLQEAAVLRVDLHEPEGAAVPYGWIVATDQQIGRRTAVRCDRSGAATILVSPGAVSVAEGWTDERTGETHAGSFPVAVQVRPGETHVVSLLSRTARTATSMQVRVLAGSPVGIEYRSGDGSSWQPLPDSGVLDQERAAGRLYEFRRDDVALLVQVPRISDTNLDLSWPGDSRVGYTVQLRRAETGWNPEGTWVYAQDRDSDVRTMQIAGRVDQVGKALLPGLTAGHRYDLTFEQEGLDAPYVYEVAIPAAADLPLLSVTLPAADVAGQAPGDTLDLSGHVWRGTRSAPAYGARVSVHGYGPADAQGGSLRFPPPGGSVTTDLRGVYRIKVVASGKYYASIEAPLQAGLRASAIRVRWTGREAEHDFELP